MPYGWATIWPWTRPNETASSRCHQSGVTWMIVGSLSAAIWDMPSSMNPELFGGIHSGVTVRLTRSILKVWDGLSNLADFCHHSALLFFLKSKRVQQENRQARDAGAQVPHSSPLWRLRDLQLLMAFDLVGRLLSRTRPPGSPKRFSCSSRGLQNHFSNVVATMTSDFTGPYGPLASSQSSDVDRSKLFRASSPIPMCCSSALCFDYLRTADTRFWTDPCAVAQ